jgi:hypothetical protein
MSHIHYINGKLFIYLFIYPFFHSVNQSFNQSPIIQSASRSVKMTSDIYAPVGGSSRVRFSVGSLGFLLTYDSGVGSA